MRPGSVFSIERYGQKWAVVCEGEPLVVTETEGDAARLAQGALVTLLSPRPPKPTPPRVAAERRSFVRGDEEDAGHPFGFPVMDMGNGR